jgi:hypothetical protein
LDLRRRKWQEAEEDCMMRIISLCVSLNIIWAIKARRMRGLGHVAHMEEMRMHTKFWSKNLKPSDHLEDLGINGRILLEQIIEK